MPWLLIKRATVFLVLFFSASLFADEYSLAKSFNLKGLFNDNATLEPDAKGDRYGGTGVARFELSKLTDVSRLVGDISLEANNYNLVSYSTFDQLMNVSYTRSNERGSWGVSGNYTRDSTRALDPEDQGLDFSGLIDSRIFSKRLNANWNRGINEKNTIAWSADVSDVEYESDFRNGYLYSQTSILWQYFVNERMRLQANIAYSGLDSDQTTNLVSSPLFFDALTSGVFTIDETLFLIDSCRRGSNQIALLGEIIYGPDNGIEPWSCFEERLTDNTQSTVQLQLGIYYKLTEKIVLDVLLGRSEVDTKSETVFLNVPPLGESSGQRIDTIESDDKGAVFRGNIKYTSESWWAALNISRNTSVNSNSVLSLLTEVGLDTRWRVNQRHSIGSGLKWSQQEASSQAGDIFFDRDLVIATLRYDFNFSREWRFSALYRFNDQVRAGQDNHGRSNQLALIVSWRPSTNTWSW
ncbi:hypothetical protein N9W57_05505 [Pseudomonadales bacterium]|nr:hypothetical protein [Pseudomonadales bacterium]